MNEPAVGDLLRPTRHELAGGYEKGAEKEARSCKIFPFLIYCYSVRIVLTFKVSEVSVRSVVFASSIVVPFDP